MVSVGEQPCQYLFRQPLGKHHDQQAVVPLPANQVHWSYAIPQFCAGSGADRSWEKTIIELVQISGNNVVH